MNCSPISRRRFRRMRRTGQSLRQTVQVLAAMRRANATWQHNPIAVPEHANRGPKHHDSSLDQRLHNISHIAQTQAKFGLAACRASPSLYTCINIRPTRTCTRVHSDAQLQLWEMRNASADTPKQVLRTVNARAHLHNRDTKVVGATSAPRAAAVEGEVGVAMLVVQAGVPSRR